MLAKRKEELLLGEIEAVRDIEGDNRFIEACALRERADCWRNVTEGPTDISKSDNNVEARQRTKKKWAVHL